jgi:hypothetical protein
LRWTGSQSGPEGEVSEPMCIPGTQKCTQTPHSGSTPVLTHYTLTSQASAHTGTETLPSHSLVCPDAYSLEHVCVHIHPQMCSWILADTGMLVYTATFSSLPLPPSLSAPDCLEPLGLLQAGVEPSAPSLGIQPSPWPELELSMGGILGCVPVARA